MHFSEVLNTYVLAGFSKEIMKNKIKTFKREKETLQKSPYLYRSKLSRTEGWKRMLFLNRTEQNNTRFQPTSLYPTRKEGLATCTSLAAEPRREDLLGSCVSLYVRTCVPTTCVPVLTANRGSTGAFT